MSIYSDFDYKPWLFIVSPRGFFSEIKNRHDYLNWLKNKVGVANLSDLKGHHFYENGGAGLRSLYGGSVARILDSVNEDSTEKTRKLAAKWTVEKQREFCDGVASKLGISRNNMDAWYQVTTDKIIELGGNALISTYYSGSVYEMIKEIYAEVDWLPWLFPQLPKIAAKDPVILLKALNSIEKKLNIADKSEWNRVTSEQLKGMAEFKVIRAVGGLQEALAKAYPDVAWENSKRTRKLKSEMKQI